MYSKQLRTAESAFTITRTSLIEGTFGGTSKSIANAGCAWAFGDFAFHCSDKILAQRVIDIAKSIEIHRAHIPRNLLPFSIVLRFSWRDIGRGIEKGSASGRPSRMFDALLVASGIW